MGAEMRLALLALLCVAAEPNAEQKFLRVGDGRCGLPYFTRRHITSSHCAILCASDPRCEGFNFAADLDETELCEVTDNVTLPDLTNNFSCYMIDRLYWFFSKNLATVTTMESTTSAYIPATDPTRNLYSTTTRITTTNEATAVDGPVIKTSDLGESGVQIIGFVESSDSFMSALIYDMPGNGSPPSAPPITTPSEVLADGGELCAADKVMIGIGPLDTGNSEKDDQRIFCSKLTLPLSLSTTCKRVKLGELPRPSLLDVDTSKWINWLACPDTYMVTGLDWVFDPRATITQYRYYEAKCCQVVTT